MIKCEKRGETRPSESADQSASNGAAPFDEKAWRRAYMRRYMKERRLRVRQVKEEGP